MIDNCVKTIDVFHFPPIIINLVTIGSSFLLLSLSEVMLSNAINNLHFHLDQKHQYLGKYILITLKHSIKALESLISLYHFVYVFCLVIVTLVRIDLLDLGIFYQYMVDDSLNLLKHYFFQMLNHQ